MSRRDFVLTLLPGAIFLAAWQIFVMGDPRRQFLFASPLSVASVAIEEFQGRSIYIDIGTTLLQALLGLVIGSLVGTAIGIGLWANDGIARISRPYVTLLGAVPIFAVAPMVIIWFGVGLESKVVMAAFAVCFLSLAQAYEGARFASREYGKYARSLGASRSFLIRKIIVPGALRWVLVSIRLNISLALIGAFVGEFVSSRAGLGHYILKAGSLYDMPRVLLGVALISMLALTMTAVTWGVERWKPHLFSR